MKLLLITAVSEYEKEVKQLLKEAKVMSYSYREVTGHTDTSLEPVESNWFGMGVHESNSLLFYAFVKKENVDAFFELVEKKNSEHRSKSRIHVASIDIEKSN